MSQNPLRHWIVVVVCCVLAMVLAWRAAHLCTKATGDTETTQSTPQVAEVLDPSASNTPQAEGEQDSQDDTQAVATEGNLLDGYGESEDSSVDDVDEAPAFVMPEGAEYEPDVTLISLADGVTAEQVNALLAETDAIATKEVSEEEVANGYILVEIAEGYTVEDAVNAVLGAEPVEAAQPNYVYHALAGDADDLRELLDEVNEPAMQASESPEQAATDDSVDQEITEVSEEGEPSAEEPEGGSSELVDTPSESSDEPEGTEGETLEDELSEEPSDEQPSDPEDTTTPEDVTASEDDASLEDSNAQPEDAELAEASAADGEDAEATEETKKEEEEPALLAQLDVNDPYSSSKSSKQWALSSIKAYGAWSVARCEGSVAVAVLDQLPDASHEDLAANVVATHDTYVTTRDTHQNSSPLSAPRDHGTHVAGIIAGVAQNGKGVAGVSYNANLVLVNVFYIKKDGNVVSSTADLLAAYTYVKNQASSLNIRVINLSVGAPIAAYDQRLIDAIDDAYTNYGIITVAACGNSPYTMKVNGSYTTYTAPYQQYPGDADNVVSVINLRYDDETGSVSRASDSNYNVPGETNKNISAPGSSIWSTTPGNHYASMNGTSMAAPHVAGVLALEFAANPDLTAEEAVSILYGTAADIGDEGWDEQYGYGEIDALAAVSAANPFLGAEVILSPTSYVYSGSSCKPDVTVRLGGTTLTKGRDYTAVYANNVNAGTGTVTITGMGSYKGFASATFSIAQAQLLEGGVTLSASSLPYTGKALKPSVTVKVGKTKLVQGTDYTVSYKNNVAVGTATVTVKGIGNYKGKVTKNFSIVLPNLSKATIDAIPAQKYTSFAHTPNPVVRMGSKTLVVGRDYTVTYKNNVKVGSATVTITGKGGYTGTRTVKFSIKKVAGAWKQSGSRWWYRWSDGTWPESQFVKIDGQTYWFDDSGWMATGWQQIGGSWYYFASSGAMVTGWQKVSGAWYWLDKSTGKMITGWQKINGARYWFASSGAMATGWQKIGNNWYYFADSGAMVANRWVGNYYLGSDGAMLRNTVTPDGYRVDADGKWDGKGKVAA